VRQVDAEGTARCVRNDEFFRWRRANELATEHTPEGLLAGLERLEAAEERFREQYGVSTPTEVEFPDETDYEGIHDRWEDTGERETVRREIAVHREATCMARTPTRRTPRIALSMADDLREPIDSTVLTSLQGRASTHPLVARVETERSNGVVVALRLVFDSERYPKSVTETTLTIRWFKNGEYNFHYRERYEDDDRRAW
jgi:hypothetical protein